MEAWQLSPLVSGCLLGQWNKLSYSVFWSRVIAFMWNYVSKFVPALLCREGETIRVTSELWLMCGTDRGILWTSVKVLNISPVFLQLICIHSFRANVEGLSTSCSCATFLLGRLSVWFAFCWCAVFSHAAVLWLYHSRCTRGLPCCPHPGVCCIHFPASPLCSRVLLPLRHWSELFSFWQNLSCWLEVVL